MIFCNNFFYIFIYLSDLKKKSSSRFRKSATFEELGNKKIMKICIYTFHVFYVHDHYNTIYIYNSYKLTVQRSKHINIIPTYIVDPLPFLHKQLNRLRIKMAHHRKLRCTIENWVGRLFCVYSWRTKRFNNYIKNLIVLKKIQRTRRYNNYLKPHYS